MDELTIVRRSRPDVELPDPEVKRRARKALFHDQDARAICDEVSSEPGIVKTMRSRDQRLSRRARNGSVALVAAAAIVVLVLGVVPSGTPGEPGVASASEILGRAAQASADRIPAEYEGYLHYETRVAEPQPLGKGVLQLRRDAYVASDGSGVTSWHYLDGRPVDLMARFLDGRVFEMAAPHRENWEERERVSKGNELLEPGSLHIGLNGRPTIREEDDFRQALREEATDIETEGGTREPINPVDERMFDIILEQLGSIYPTPEQLSWFYRAVVDLSGVEVEAGVRDLLSRPAIAVTMHALGVEDPNERSMMLFDPESFVLRGTRHYGHEASYRDPELVDALPSNLAAWAGRQAEHVEEPVSWGRVVLSCVLPDGTTISGDFDCREIEGAKPLGGGVAYGQVGPVEKGDHIPSASAQWCARVEGDREILVSDPSWDWDGERLRWREVPAPRPPAGRVSERGCNELLEELTLDRSAQGE